LVLRCSAPTDAALQATLQEDLRVGRAALRAATTDADAPALSPAFRRLYPVARDVSRVFAQARPAAHALACARQTLTQRACSQSAQRDEDATLSAAFGADWAEHAEALRDALCEGDLDALERTFGGAAPPLSVHSCSGQGLAKTWLSFCAEYAPVAVCARLLALGAAIEARDVFGDNCIHAAARRGNAENTIALLAAAARADATAPARLLAEGNLSGSTPLHLAVMADDGLACVMALCEAGAPLNAQTFHELWTPAHFAVRSGKPDVLKYLITTGPRAQQLDFTRRSAPPQRCRLLALALAPLPTPHAAAVRQAAVEEACRRERVARGSGDPDDALGLYGTRGGAAGGGGGGGMMGMPAGLPFPLAALLFGAAGAGMGGAGMGMMGRGYIPDSDPEPQPQPASGAHLARRGRVLRYRDGASIAEPSELAPSQFIDPARLTAHHPALLALLMATHARLGADSPARLLPRDAVRLIARKMAAKPRRSCAARCGGAAAAGRAVRCLCALKGHPCFSDCAAACYARNPAVAQRTCAVGLRARPPAHRALAHARAARGALPAGVRGGVGRRRDGPRARRGGRRRGRSHWRAPARRAGRRAAVRALPGGRHAVLLLLPQPPRGGRPRAALPLLRPLLLLSPRLHAPLRLLRRQPARRGPGRG
jgi:hypothetical protein